MGFTEFLTVVFIVLKLIDVIDWSWWLVLLPEIIGFVLYIAIFVTATISTSSCRRRLSKWR